MCREGGMLVKVGVGYRLLYVFDRLQGYLYLEDIKGVTGEHTMVPGHGTRIFVDI